MPLTDVAIRKAKPTDSPVHMFDGGGLYIEVVPSGGKWWRLKYRYAGKEKRLSLGTYPHTGLKAARNTRDTARKQLVAGVDPSADRKAEKENVRIAALSTLERAARAWLAHRATAWKPGTLTMITASLENDVFPSLGSRPLASIQPRDTRDAVQAIEARGASEAAGRVFQRLRAVFRYAVADELVEADPTYPLKPSEIFKPRGTRHRTSLGERDVSAFLTKLDGYEGSDATKAALVLLMLTAVRPGELRGARWDEIDEPAALWRIPASRMKMNAEHTVPLSKQAVRMIVPIRKVSGDGALLFPSPFYPGKPLSDGTLNSALARLGYKGIATAHGFRTLFSTCANEGGWNSDVIEKQLAHEERDEVRGAYNRAQWLAERNRLMQWWADRLDQLRRSAKITSIKAP